MAKFHVGMARVFLTRQIDFSAGGPRAGRQYVRHGCWGTFFTTWRSYFFGRYKSQFQIKYDYSDVPTTGDTFPWDQKVKFFRNGFDIMEVIRENLHGKVAVHVLVYQQEVRAQTHPQQPAPDTEYLHLVTLSFTNPQDAIMVKMILK